MTFRVRRALALAAVVTLGATACTGGPEEKPVETSTSATESDPDAVIESDDDPKSGDVRWRTRGFPSPVRGFAEVGDGYVVTTEASTVRLDADGTEEWVVREPAQDRQLTESWVEGGVVVRYTLTRDTRDADGNDVEGSIRLRVLDGLTGEVLWTGPGGDTQVTPQGVFVGSCGDDGCSVVRRDLRTGRIRWQSPTSDALGSIDVSDGAVRVISYPYGTDRTADPYAERSLLQVLDLRTGEQLGSDLLGNSFTSAGRVMIEESYAGSVGESCTVDLVARRLNGRDLWRRSFDWKLSKEDREKDWDCALSPSYRPLVGNRIDLTVRTRLGLVLDTTSGRTLWNHGGQRLITASDPESGIDVVTGYGFRQYVGVSSVNYEERWRASGESTYAESPDGFILLSRDRPEGSKGFELRSLADGEVALSARGSYLTSGSDWAAVTDETNGGARVAFLHWPR